MCLSQQQQHDDASSVASEPPDMSDFDTESHVSNGTDSLGLDANFDIIGEGDHGELLYICMASCEDECCKYEWYGVVDECS